LANIDSIVELIKNSSSVFNARKNIENRDWIPGSIITMLKDSNSDLCRPRNLSDQYGLRENRYYLSEIQVQAILELKLSRLTGLECEKLIEEYQHLLKKILGLLDILKSEKRLTLIVREELQVILQRYGDPRRTEILNSYKDLTLADLIPVEQRVVTLSYNGYAKTQPVKDYQSQHRGGRGKASATMKENDFVEHLLVASSHDTIMCFTSRGKVYWLRVFEIPQASRIAKGRPIINILPLESSERITAILQLPQNICHTNHYVFMATSKGIVKRTALSAFSRPRSNGLIAVDLNTDDTLIGVAITNGIQDVMLFASNGLAVRFNEKDVRIVGRPARGVRGMRLSTKAKVVSLVLPKKGGHILTASENGYGKQCCNDDFLVRNRGGKGLIAMQISERNGSLVSGIQVFNEDEIILISNQGTLVRIKVCEISILGRNTQGVTLIKITNDEKLAQVGRVMKSISEANDNMTLNTASAL
jgi:DNA gyrase subunit A